MPSKPTKIGQLAISDETIRFQEAFQGIENASDPSSRKEYLYEN